MLQSQFRINEVAGVNIAMATDGSLSIGLCFVKANGNELDITKKVTGLTDLKDVRKHIPAKTPVALNLTGKGILIKQAERVEEISQTQFSKLLPNGKLEDFYIQNFVSGEHSFVSLIRQKDADIWISKLKELGYVTLIISLGPFITNQVIPQLNVYGEQIIFDGHNIQRDEHAAWTGYRYVAGSGSPFPVKLETEKIDEQLIIPYASAFQLILSTHMTLISAEVPALTQMLKSALTDRKLTVSAYAALAVLFVLLLINFVLFSHYNSANGFLMEKVGRSTKNVTDVESLNQQIKEKEALIDTLGWDGGINKSVLIDRIAQLLPPDVSWQEVSVNPVEVAHQTEQKSIHFVDRTIRVTGNAQRIISVNEWVGRIKSLTWVKNVQMQSYSYSNELNTGQFTVIIKY